VVVRPAISLALSTLLLAGCAARRPQFQYLKQNDAALLIPPGVRNATIEKRTFVFASAARPACAASEGGVDIRPHPGSLRVTVERHPLFDRPPGWLPAWTAALEQRKCLAPGEGLPLATLIAEALPAKPEAEQTLLHPNPAISGYVDLGPDYKLKVVSPILREGAPPGASALKAETVTAEGHSISIDIKTSDDFLGYETAWYAMASRDDRPGSRIVAISAQASIGAEVKSEAGPRRDYFRFAPDAAYFRLFFLTRVSHADHDLAILAAPTRAVLDEHTRQFEADPELCGKMAGVSCVLIPKDVAVLPHVSVNVNGREILLVYGNVRVSQAIREAGEKDPQRTLPTLTVERWYGSKRVPVQFDRNSSEILGLTLTGGESIRWR
jgi:hypothetical protein